MRKKGIEIKKQILNNVKKRECSLRELETKINTNYLTIRSHCEELKFLKIIEIIHYKKNLKNGKPYTTVKLTEDGIKLLFS